MSKIVCHGEVSIPESMLANADKIKFQNYQVNKPSRFRRRNDIDTQFKQELARKVNADYEKLDFVYFSACQGAEPHVDQLDPQIFKAKTYVIPVILPCGTSTITAEDETLVVKLNHVYEFNHEKIHSMALEDTESGCVVIMVAEKF